MKFSKTEFIDPVPVKNKPLIDAFIIYLQECPDTYYC